MTATPEATHRSGAVAVAVPALLALLLALLCKFLVNLNQALSATPAHFRELAPRPGWTRAQIRETHDRLAAAAAATAAAAGQQPVTTTASSCAAQLPPRLDRRYIVTGGSGMVGGYIVLQLLARGHPPEAIRIVDFQPPRRADMLAGPAAAVAFRRADLSSAAQTAAAFAAPWPTTPAAAAAVAALPLTVFHTAAVMVPSARSPLVGGFCEAVNVGGTANVLAAARDAGADVLVSTSSASIAIRPVGLWRGAWGGGRLGWGPREPQDFAQVLDEADFFAGPVRPHHEFYANYPASKARAERLVCGANGPEMRTGCIRPCNGVYGQATDNLVGTPLSMQTYHSWANHIIQSFVHGINCALAHLQLEAVLADPASASAPQAGRPFVVTDPGPPITYGDLYHLLTTLAATPFRLVTLPPVPMLLLSYAVEFYNLLPARVPLLDGVLPRLPGALSYLEPGLFSICTHLVGNADDARKPVAEGGIGYRGVMTTLEGMCLELLEWNREQEEHAKAVAASSGGGGGAKGNGKPAIKAYLNSLSLAEEIRKLGGVGNATNWK